MTIKLKKATISLNKYERCSFKVRRCCFVKCGYRGKRYISAVPKVKPAGRERIRIFNKPASAIFATYLLNVNRWIDKKLMHDKNLNK